MDKEDYAFLDSQSEHRDRLGDTSNMNPEFAARLSTAIRQAQAAGLPVKVMSGFREGSVTGSPYDVGGNSSHTYGLASDIDGLDGPNGKITQQWAQIAEANGLHNPYGTGNKSEFNHWQLPEQPLEKTPDLLNQLKAAKTSGNMTDVWNAYNGAKPVADRTGAIADTTGGVDVRNSVYQMLVGKGLNANQAMGVVYSMMGESGTGLNAGSLGDSGKSIGFGQWNGDRRANLEATAKSMGVAPTDPSAQLAHFKNEIDGPYAAEIANVKNNASSAADATRLWTGSVGEKSGYERPEKNNWQQRFATGSQAGKIGDDGSPVWTTPSSQPTGTPAPTAVASTPGPPTSVGDAIAKLTKDDKSGASPLSKLGEAFAPKGAQLGMGSEPMLQAPQDTSAMLAGPAQQLMANNMASMKPLSWSTSPYGTGTAGPQQLDPASQSVAAGQFGIRPPGLTLNSLSPFGYG